MNTKRLYRNIERRLLKEGESIRPVRALSIIRDAIENERAESERDVRRKEIKQEIAGLFR